MRILMLSDVYFPRVNGVSTSIRTFADEFQRLGHEVTLIAPAYATGTADAFEILRVPARSVPLDREDRLMAMRRVRALAPALARRGFGVIHVQTPFVAHYAGLWLARRLGVPVVETYHTYFEEYLDKYLKAVPRPWLRLLARRFSAAQCNAVDALVVPTAPMLEVLRGYGIRAPATVIPTGLPEEAFRPGDGAAFRARHGIASGRPVLLFVGRVAHEKNIGFLLEVLPHVLRERPEALLLIAGEGPARGRLEAEVRRRGLAGQVRFVGYLERGQPLADCYAAGDVFVFASRTETQGLVLLEAMALGLPVVTTAVLGTAAVMADRRGGIVVPEDAGQFAAAVLALLAQPALRAARAQDARAKAREWSAPAMAHRVLELYAGVRRFA
jgi:glycosyltransferase involved in cell wall biosynthesis